MVRPEPAPGASSAFSGRWVLPLVALWIAFSCSRAFGISGVGGLPDITLERLCLCALIAYAITKILPRRRGRGGVVPVEVGLWALILICLVSAYLTGGLEADRAAGNINLLTASLIYPTIVFMILMRTGMSARDVVVFCAILAVFAIYLGVTAILERTPFTWALFPQSIGDPSQGIHFGRSRGPWLESAFNGTVMAQLFPYMILLHAWGNRTWRTVSVIALVLICVGVFLTDTRACMMGLAAVTLGGAVVPGPDRRLYRTILAVIVVGGLGRFIVGAVLVPRLEEADPVNARLNLLVATAEMIMAHPIVGSGFGSFFDKSREYFNAARMLGDLSYTDWSDVGSHNTFLTPLAEIGVFAGSLYFILICRAIANGYRALNGRPPEPDPRVRALLVCNLLVGLPFLLGGFTVDYKWALTPNALLWVGAAFTERYLTLMKTATSPARVGAAARGTLRRKLAGARG